MVNPPASCDYIYINIRVTASTTIPEKGVRPQANGGG